MIAFMICKIRKGLLHAKESPESSEHVVELATILYNKFKLQWGCGYPGTVATEYLTKGPRRRPKGIPKLALVATLLDPRFKFGAGLADDDKNYIWNLIRPMMCTEAALEVAAVVKEPTDSEDNNNDNTQQQPPHQQRHIGYVDAMFLELSEMAMAEQAINEQDNNDYDYIDEDTNINKQVDAELLLYKREPHLPLRKVDGHFSNPLDWWRLKQQQYPLLARIACKVLAIPATSAPSERVFSIAGIRIAKERARLDPANAAELIFLHDATPAIQRYEASIR
jgi:hypothetical protein